MHQIKFIFISILFFLIPALSHGQGNDTIHYSLSLHGHYGFIIPHADEIKPVSGTNPYGIEFDFIRTNLSFGSWKIFNTYWSSGIQSGYYSFGNPEILGGAFTLTAFAEPVIINRTRLTVSVRAGAGLSYHTRIYDTIDNPANKFFATRASFPVYVSARINYKLGSKSVITVAGNYNHISNGGIKQPNFGMNFPTVSLGMQYFPSGSPRFEHNYHTDKKIDPRVKFLVQLLSAYKVVDETDLYPERGALAIGLHLRASRQLTSFYALNAGGEVILDGAIKERIRRLGSDTDHKRFALTAGQDFLFGNASFTQYFGFYIYSPYKAFRNIYQKYELSYRLNNLVSAGFFLKAHLYVAEIMGLQVSFHW